MKACKFFVFALLISFRLAAAQEDHDHEEEEAFHELVEAVTGTHNEMLRFADVQKLFENLELRFHDENVQCFDRIEQRLDSSNNAQYDGSMFLETAKILLTFLMTGDCSDNADEIHQLLSSSEICRYGVREIIHELGERYENFSTQTCFNEHTVLSENCTSENALVVYEIVRNLYEGNCLLPEYSDFVNELFEHIGVEDDTVSDESYARLLNDLQIGQIQTDTTDTDDHDHDHADDDDHNDDNDDDHDHARKKRQDDHDHGAEETGTNVCYSGEQIRSIFGFSGSLNRENVITMCPIFIQQILEGSCLPRVEDAPTNTTSEFYTDAMKYGYGTIAVVIITLLAVIAIIFFPIMRSSKFQLVLQFFMALGVGALSGDAIFHLIPEVVGIHNHEESAEEVHDHEEEGVPDYVWKLLVVVAALWLFFLFESVLRLFPNVGHDHRIEPSPNMKHNTDRIEIESIVAPVEIIHNANFIGADKQAIANEDQNYNEKKRFFCFGLTSVGIMVFIGDVIHNFGDGLAIGAAFSVSWPLGVGTTFAIGFHELPHEIGDFALYLNNGLSKWKALLFNLIAACFNFLGLYIGLVVSEDPGVRIWLLAFVAGMFLYISLANVLHQILEAETDHPYWQFALQNFGLFLGWTILFLISVFEERLVNAFR